MAVCSGLMLPRTDPEPQLKPLLAPASTPIPARFWFVPPPRPSLNLMLHMSRVLYNAQRRQPQDSNPSRDCCFLITPTSSSRAPGLSTSERGGRFASLRVPVLKVLPTCAMTIAVACSAPRCPGPGHHSYTLKHFCPSIRPFSTART